MGEIGERVRAALERAQPPLAQRDLAEAAQMAPDALSRALSGHRRFSAVELAQVAETLRADLHWLITGDTDPYRPRVAARHTFDHDTGRRHVPGQDRDAAMLDDVRLAYRQAPSLVHRERVDLPSSADEVRACLGDDFVRPFAERLEATLDVDVVRLPGLSTAWSLQIVNRPLIVVSATGNWFHENWSIAHELGHLALRHLATDAEGRVTDEEEASANAFAAQLLMPEERVRDLPWPSISTPELAHLVWDWGVSTDAIGRRLAGLGLAVPSTVREWASQPTQRLLRRHWRPSDPFDDEITRRMDQAAARRFPVALQNAHIEAIGVGAVGKATLGWMLGVDPATLDVDAPAAPDSFDADELLDVLGI